VLFSLRWTVQCHELHPNRVQWWRLDFFSAVRFNFFDFTVYWLRAEPTNATWEVLLFTVGIRKTSRFFWLKAMAVQKCGRKWGDRGIIQRTFLFCERNLRLNGIMCMDFVSLQGTNVKKTACNWRHNFMYFLWSFLWKT
jgi:hypothetical protein